MSQGLRVVGVQVKDVLGAREFNLEPGKITVLAGRNGSGKSTALAAVQAALGGGNLARLARVDPELAPEDIEPEVVLLLEGAGSEAYRVERKGDKLRVRQRVGDTAAFEDVPKPQAWLTSLFDPRGANPVRFLTADDKERALLLLEALPLKMNRAELLLAMGIRPDELPPIPTANLHPLEELAFVRDAVFRMRTGVNRDQKGKAAAADQTRRAAPAAVPEDPGPNAEIDAEAACSILTQEIAREEEKTAAAREAAVRAAEQSCAQKAAEVSGQFKAEAAKLRTEHERVIAEMRAEVERQVAERAAKLEVAITDLREKGEATMDAAEVERDKATTAAHDAYAKASGEIVAKREALAAARQRLTSIRDKREQAASARALHEQAKQFDEDAAQLEKEAGRLTAAIEALDKYRRKLAKDLPIAGLEIEGKEIRVNGIPYEQLNTAQRVEIAVKVATLRAHGQKLPVVFVDGAEQLDSEHFGLLVRELDRAGVQAFVARVEDHDLQVVTEPAGAETHA